MIIKILGGGCPKCDRLEAITREVVAALGQTAEFEHVKAMPEIMAYDVMVTPALVIDEQVVCSGRIPTRDEIREWLTSSTDQQS